MHNNEFFHFLLCTLKGINRILPVLFWISVMLSFDETPIAMLTLTCALTHEVGHILTLIVFSDDSFTLKGVSSGLRITGQRLRSYKKEIMLYLSGPFFNIVFAFLSVLLKTKNPGFASTFAVLNLATAFSNLLPIEGYDGYGAIKSFLLLKGLNSTADTFLPIISFLTLLILCICSLYFIDRLGEGYWIFFVFAVSLIKKLDFAITNLKNEI